MTHQVSTPALAFLFVATLTGPVAAQEEPPPGPTMVELERRAAERFPEVEAASAQVEALEAELREVLWSPFSGLRVSGTFSPTPERRGDALHAAQGDIYLSDSWGVLFRLQVDLTLPLYGFGRLPAARDAARSEVEAGRADLQQARRQTRARVQQAWTALQLARQTQSLLEEGRSYLGRAKRHVDESLEAGSERIRESDRLQLLVVEAELEARLSDTRRAVRLALAALRLLVGGDEGTEPLEVPTPPLEPREQELGELQAYLDEALERRADLTAAQARTAAASARRRAARAGFFPELRLVADLDYAYSNVVDDQRTPFAADAFNYLRYGVGLQLTWGLDFGTDTARLRQAEARVRQSRAEQQAARDRITLEVEEAYIAVEETEAVMLARRRGRRASRGWLFSIMQGIDLGVLEPRELVDALRAYFEQSFLYLDALSRFNGSVSNLELTVGRRLGGHRELSHE